MLNFDFRNMDIHLKCSENEEIKYSPNQAIAAGVNHDICSLIHKVTALFDEYRTPRFRHFIDIWKDMKFGLIFCGRQTFRELFEFTEDLFDLVKLQAITLTKFGNRAAAVYLLYALYFKQPARPLVSISEITRWHCKYLQMHRFSITQLIIIS